MAANWLATSASLPECHDPNVWVLATTSMYLAGLRRRGGAVGNVQNTSMPMTLTRTRLFRSGLYIAGARSTTPTRERPG